MNDFERFRGINFREFGKKKQYKLTFLGAGFGCGAAVVLVVFFLAKAAHVTRTNKYQL